MTAVRAEDISGPVHVLRKDGTVLGAATFEESFELGKGGAAGAMEGNVCQFGVFWFLFGTQHWVVSHCLEQELELRVVIRSEARVHEEMACEGIINQSGSLDSGSESSGGGGMFLLEASCSSRGLVGAQIGRGASEDCLTVVLPNVEGIVNLRVKSDAVCSVNHIG